MVFEFWPALLAGFTGAIAMTILMNIATRMGMTHMPGMPLIQGAMATDDPGTAKRIGMFTHIIVMGTIVFGLAYAALFAAFGTASWLAGVIIGLVHGAVAGVFFKMMGQTHPRMEPVANFAGSTTWTHEEGRLRIAKPGLFGRNWGAGTPMGVLVAHAVYGLVVALVYSAVI